MKRLAIFALALGVVLAASAADAAPRLRSAVSVSGPLVTLGDLFTGAGEAADTAVFQAPDPGTTGTVSTARVLAAAAAHGIEPEATAATRVSVTRSSRLVGEDDLKHAIAEAMAGSVATAGEVEIELDRFSEIHVEEDAIAPLTLSRFDFDPATSRFAAVAEIADSDMLVPGIRVTGRALRIVELPVLQRPIKRGETIGASDVVLERLPLSRAPQDAARSLSEVVGKSARSSLRAGAPVPADRLMPPILVNRNDVVTIVYRSPGLLLTVRGRALGEGARGELVTVMNNQSNRTIEATVAGPGEVVVEPPSRTVTTVASK